MSRGVNHPREDWQEQQGARRQARRIRVEWADLEFIDTTHGYFRKLRITHVPTGVVAEAEGYHVGKRELRDRIFPVLVRAVGRYRPDPEPVTKLSGVSTEVPDDEPQAEELPDEPAEA